MAVVVNRLVSGIPATIQTTVISSTVTYTAIDTDDKILVDATGGARIVNLPTAVGRGEKWFTVKKVDSSSNTVTIDGSGSETIDGATTYVITNQYESITVVSDGANWLIV